MDAPFDGHSDPTAILSHFPSRIIDPVHVHGTSFIQTLVLGPVMGLSNGQGAGGFDADFEFRREGGEF